MKRGRKRLERLLAIRRLNEDLDRRTLALALAAVAEVETALARQEETQAEARLAAQAALAAGERGEWLLADAQSEVAGWNRGRLGCCARASRGGGPGDGAVPREPARHWSR